MVVSDKMRKQLMDKGSVKFTSLTRFEIQIPVGSLESEFVSLFGDTLTIKVESGKSKKA